MEDFHKDRVKIVVGMWCMRKEYISNLEKKKKKTEVKLAKH
jgi:hypothetical protein